MGNRPTGPTDTDKFVYANTTYLSLRLDAWDDHKCEILYFVVEYKLESSDSWTTGKEFNHKSNQNVPVHKYYINMLEFEM